MERFISFIDTALPGDGKNEELFRFKRKLLDEMELRAKEASSRGVENRKVIEDLVISEHPDLKAEFEEFERSVKKSKRAKKLIKGNAIGSVVYLLSVVALFLLVSFATHAWEMTWAIVVDGVLLWVVYLLSIGVRVFASMKKIFHVFARICLAGAVIVSTVAFYILIVALTDLERSWLIVIAGLIAMFISDGVFAVAAKHRLALISWLIYIPVIATFVFIIFGALSVMPWGAAWIMIPLSLILDVFIILLSIGKNKHEKTEVFDAWNEN